MKTTTYARLLAMGTLLLVGAGCGRRYEEHEITDVSANAGGSLDRSSLTVTLPVGAVLTATMVPYDNKDDPMDEAAVSTDEPDVMDVLRVSGDATTFAFVGRRPGTTTVRYYAEGREVRSERATVTTR